MGRGRGGVGMRREWGGRGDEEGVRMERGWGGDGEGVGTKRG